MSDQSAVPMIIITTQQDHVAAINSALRNAGHAVHCTWISDARDLADAFLQTNCELVLVFVESANASLKSVIKVRDQVAATVPVIVARTGIDEAVIAEAMREGARDVVSLEHTFRLQAVVARELRAFRMERALQATLASANEYKQQLQAFVEGSADAIAQVQEGIIVGTNPAWLELFGYPEEDEALVGQPLMDLFEAESHAALKGALVACLQNKWTGHTLRLSGLSSDGSTMAVALLLERTDIDGEPAVCIRMPAQEEREDEPVQRLENVLQLDATTGLYHRRYFLERLEARLGESIRGGVRALAYVTPDKFSEIVAELGPLGSEELLAQVARQLAGFMQPTDLYGRLGGTMFAALLERGTPRDVEAWGENAAKRISGALFEISGKSISVTTTVGIAIAREDTGSVDRLLTAAMQANNEGRGLGGNQVRMNETVDTDTRIHAYDQIWVKHIKSALMENRFRLIHQPIASLAGDDQGMYDILLRMVDVKGKEVLPKEFLPAAERNGLMKNVDRWVIGAAIVFCAKRTPQRVFVRLSKDSVNDPSLLEWLASHIGKARVTPGKLCFQVTEEDARQLLKQTRDLAASLQKAGFGFAVEHFGAGRDPTRIFNHIPMNYLKIDGSLMQGLATNQALQEKIRDFVEEARSKNIQTIAERVEDANTMAVLWQVGVSFMQGYYVKEPDVVLQETS
ncbi:MAG: EAL domain-containing protein [Gammaproteobacteria bacterium]